MCARVIPHAPESVVLTMVPRDTGNKAAAELYLNDLNKIYPSPNEMKERKQLVQKIKDTGVFEK